jgi:hypothetical protein
LIKTSPIFHLFDKYDYQKLEITESWLLGDVIKMLISFYMQTNDLCNLEEYAEDQSRLFDNYCNYFFGILHAGKLKHKNIYGEYDTDQYEPGEHIGTGVTWVNKDELLNYLESNNVLKLDIARLKRFLTWDEFPNNLETVNRNLISNDEADSNQQGVTEPDQLMNNGSSSNITDVLSKYVFKCKNHYWDVVYDGKQILVKDSLGIKYIAYLIKKKHTAIDWADLSNEINGISPDLVEPGTKYEDVNEGFNLSEGKMGRIHAAKDKKLLQLQINELSKDLSAAKACDNYEEAEALAEQIEKIEKYVMDTYRKDGTLKESSGSTEKLMNGIKAAIKRALEDIEGGLPDLRNHLNESIVQKWQRSKPGYFPSVEINWQM